MIDDRDVVGIQGWWGLRALIYDLFLARSQSNEEEEEEDGNYE